MRSRGSSTSLFRRNIDRDPPTLGENVVIEGDLLQRFVDDGDMMLGRALETDAGRDLYDRIRNRVRTGYDQFSVVYDFYYKEALCAKYSSLTTDDTKILVLKMIEKATADLIREQLKPTE
ncbi:MAG: hypothetical protein Q8Q89_05210 [bacterium]|nr:hypothetical protein [bacterium]